jgi:hypothetical protein
MNWPALPPGDSDDPALEVETRRLSERHPDPAHRFVSVIGWPGGPTRSGQVNDVSASGIGLLMSQRLPVGALVLIELDGLAQGTPGLHPAWVVHATRRDDDTWLVGCRFVHRLGDAEEFVAD